MKPINFTPMLINLVQDHVSDDVRLWVVSSFQVYTFSMARMVRSVKTSIDRLRLGFGP